MDVRALKDYFIAFLSVAQTVWDELGIYSTEYDQ